MLRGLLIRAGLTIGSMLLPLSMACAGVVDYSATALGGNLWRYDYTINNTPGIVFDEMSIYFDVNRYELLTSPVAPAGWDPLVMQPEPVIPADGVFDVLNLNGYVANGETVPGFSVTFAYLGLGDPGVQSFDLLDSSEFIVTYSGRTSSGEPGGNVPEPGSAVLVVLALCLAFAPGKVTRA